jgi:hypothetical protein
MSSQMFVSVRPCRTLRGLPSDLATCCTARVQFPTVARDIFLLHSVQTGSEAHPAFYTMSTGALFPGGKAAGREADCSPPPFGAEVMYGRTVLPLPHTPSWRNA